jgi:endonuclease/exonuclease/phosphatase (EEP) superfamily protein YafD
MISRRVPRWTSLLLAVPAVITAVASGLSFYGSLWWPLDLAANFRPHFAVALLSMALFLILAARRRLGVGVLVVGLVNAATVAPLFVAPAGAGEPLGSTLTVMTFNVNGLNDRYAEVIEYIRAEDPDVVFIHEATFLWEDAFVAADLPYRVEPGRQEPLDFGTVALVPEAAQFRTFGFATTAPRAVEVVLEVGEATVRLLGTHPLSPSTEQRASLRDAQLGFARDWSAESGGRRIVAGDLNATPWSLPFRRLVSDGGLFNSQRGYGLELSFPARSSPLVQVPIDHVLYSEGFAVVDRRLGPPFGSDHLSVVVDLALVQMKDDR